MSTMRRSSCKRRSETSIGSPSRGDVAKMARFVLLLVFVFSIVPDVHCKQFASQQQRIDDGNDRDRHALVVANSGPGGFRLATVNEELVKCLTSFHGSYDGTDVRLDSFVAAFREICKVFKYMGTVFNFVTSDLEHKIQILETYRARVDTGEHFISLTSMIKYETAAGTIRSYNPPSGSRTWLRLHWALQFVSTFFSRLSSADFQVKMSGLARECYEQTLAKHHGFFVRKGVSLAMYALPTADSIFANSRDNKSSIRSLLYSVGNNAARVYRVTQKIMKNRGLMDLP